MTATPYPLPREIRESTVLVGDGTAGPYGPTTFKVFDVADVVVWAKASGETYFSDVTAAVTVAKTDPDAAYDTVSVTFNAAQPATTSFVIQAARQAERSLAVTRAGAIAADQLEKELSKQATAQSEIRRDLGRTMRLDFGATAVSTLMPALASGMLIGWGASGLENKVYSDLPQVAFPGTPSRYLRNDAAGAPAALGATESGNLDLLAASAASGRTYLDAAALASDNAFSGRSTVTRTADETGRPPFQIVKSASPLNFNAAAYNSPTMAVQWSDSTAMAASSARDAHVFRADVTGDGYVELTADPSGGTSYSIWRGLLSAMNKTGDGSAHCFTGIGTLGAAGAVGYNEHGGIIYSAVNAGSWNGTIHGSELLVRDGTGAVTHTGTAQAGASGSITLAAGASSVDNAYKDLAIRIDSGTGAGQYRRIAAYAGATRVATVNTWSVQPDATSVYSVFSGFPTYLLSHIARTQRNYAGTKDAISYLASAEGSVSSSAILRAINSSTATYGWNIGIDFSGVTFGSAAILLHNTSGLKSMLADNATTSLQILGVDANDNTVINPPTTAKNVQIKDGAGTELMRFDASLVAGNPVYIRVSNAMKQVSQGVNDSGGAGFKVLRVPNT